MFPIMFTLYSLLSCTNLFNTIYLFYLYALFPITPWSLSSVISIFSIPKPRGPTWSREPCFLSSLLWMLVSGDRSVSALPWHASRWLLSSDATISQPEQTRWTERGSERVRGRKQRKGRGGWAECSATQHSEIPRSTCLPVSVLVYEAGWGRQREWEMGVYAGLYVVQHSDAAVEGVFFIASWSSSSEYVCVCVCKFWGSCSIICWCPVPASSSLLSSLSMPLTLSPAPPSLLAEQ